MTNKCDQLNMNNINVLMNNVVDSMIMNEQDDKKKEEYASLKMKCKETKIVDVNEVISKQQETMTTIEKRGNNKYVFDNISKLEEWCGNKFSNVLYDSDIDGKEGKMFRSKILNHQHLYFIIIDSDNNVFGHYLPSKIYRANNRITDSGMFMFILNSNGRCEIKKCDKLQSIYTKILTNEKFYECGDLEHNYVINSLEPFDSSMKNISEVFSNVTNTDVIGQDCTTGVEFSTQRLIVIEMF